MARAIIHIETSQDEIFSANEVPQHCQGYHRRIANLCEVTDRRIRLADFLLSPAPQSAVDRASCLFAAAMEAGQVVRVVLTFRFGSRGEWFKFGVMIHQGRNDSKVLFDVTPRMNISAMLYDLCQQVGEFVGKQASFLMTSFPPGVWKVDVCRRDRMRFHVLDQEFASITPQDPPIGKFALRDPFCPAASFRKIEFDSQPVRFRSGDGRIKQKLSATTSNIQFDGMIVPKERFPVDYPVDFINGGEVRMEINDGYWHGLDKINEGISG